MSSPEVVMVARHGVGELIDQYAEGKLTYTELYVAVGNLGYSTVSLYEMVRHIPRPELKKQ
jgi:hypothetical protein